MIEVRPLLREDETSWRNLWSMYLRFYETSLPEEIYAASFASLVDPRHCDYNGFIAKSNGDSVGLAHYIYHRHGWKTEQVCYLQDLYVADEARGKGVGRALIEAVYRAADDAGRSEVYWLTQTFNTRARRLYDRVGNATPFIKYRR